MSASASCLTIGQLVGSYRVIRTLGEGAMGEVYEVHDSALDRRAALKVVPPSMARENGVVARFRREAQAASQVRHAGVVHIFDYGVLPEPLSSPYFIMEYLEGETLHTRLKRAAGRPGGCLGLSCLPVMRQIAIALAAVHRRGLVHRDLKPAKCAAVARSRRAVRGPS
jgi:serine/threonine-protein kinase